MTAYRVDRVGFRLIEYQPGVPLEAILTALKTPGEILKQSHKATTRRVGGWVIKESRRTFSECLKHALNPRRYRRGWVAAKLMKERGIAAPEPVASIELRQAGLTFANTTIIEYLKGYVSVEEYARRMVEGGATPGRIAAYLGDLANAVARLGDAKAYHSDLSGKNIYTQNGAEFRFIDLDAVAFDHPQTEAMSLLNHVQLYDSFCDLWDDTYLEPFLAPLIPPDRDIEDWMERVRTGQATRRARTEGIWRKQGRM